MFEKVNPSHPDKLADRIAGAIVDYCYTKEENPRVAVEVLLGHGNANIIVESSVEVTVDIAAPIVHRICGDKVAVSIQWVPQDTHLAQNQDGMIRCGDNGIFKGMPVTGEQRTLSAIARKIYKAFPTDGKYILQARNEEKGDYGRFIICQSNADEERLFSAFPDATINPLGPWTGGPDVDSGATNRKLGSDMGDAVTGGGLHGKDLSKADVSLNIYAHLLAQQLGEPVELLCAIGDEEVAGIPYKVIVDIARGYINKVGGFEKFAEWGLI